MFRTSFAAAGFLVCASLGFAGETPIGTEVVVRMLSQPTDIQFAPDQPTRLYFTQKRGLLRIVDLTTNTVLPTPFLDITPLVDSTSSTEVGLIGFCFDPDYEKNGFVYLHHSEFGTGNCVFARYTRSFANPDVLDPDSRFVFLHITQPAQLHRGGFMAFGPDGYLWMSTGDGGGQNDPSNRAQNLTLLQGKILRVDPSGDDFPEEPQRNYRIPPDNPFVGQGIVRPEIFAYGLRNPFRCSFDRLTGDLWVGDVGQNQREEIDFIPAGDPGGQNFGWRCMEGTRCTGMTGCTCNDAAISLPFHEYDHTVGQAVTCGFVYRGCAIPDLRGTFFFADFAASKVFSLRRDNGVVTDLRDRTAEFDPPTSLDLRFISTWGQGLDGELYLTDFNGGEIFKMVPVGVPPAPCVILGDMNCNGLVNVGDIAGFVLALTDPAAYAASFPDCEIIAGDMNQNGEVNVGDIGLFVQLVTSN